MVDDSMNGNNIDKQKQYIVAKIDNMLEGLGPGYGESFMAELIVRLERTVARFHSEVTELLETLKTKSREQDSILKELMAEDGKIDNITQTDSEKSLNTDADEEMSEWEQRLVEKSQKNGKSRTSGQSELEEKPKKRRLFGKKGTK